MYKYYSTAACSLSNSNYNGRGVLAGSSIVRVGPISISFEECHRGELLPMARATSCAKVFFVQRPKTEVTRRRRLKARENKFDYKFSSKTFSSSSVKKIKLPVFGVVMRMQWFRSIANDFN